jgi:hypothetical protein
MSHLFASPVLSQTPEAIREAARRCLARIKDGSAALGVIAEFLDELKDAGWDENSIHAVDAAVRRVLKGLVEADEGPTFED